VKFDEKTKLLTVTCKEGAEKGEFRNHLITFQILDKDCKVVVENLKCNLKPKKSNEIPLNSFSSTNGPFYVIPNYALTAYVCFEFTAEERKFFSANILLLDRWAQNVFMAYNFMEMRQGKETILNFTTNT